MNKKTIIAYFSATGTTKKVSEELSALLSCPLYEIKPTIPYNSADLNWMNKNSRSSREMSTKDSRPSLLMPLPDLNEYDSILLGFPIWWYVEPRIIDTFLDTVDCKGKEVVLFATSGGSSLERAYQHLKETYPLINFKKGQVLKPGMGKAFVSTL